MLMAVSCRRFATIENFYLGVGKLLFMLKLLKML